MYPSAIIALGASFNSRDERARRVFFIAGVCLMLAPLAILTVMQQAY